MRNVYAVAQILDRFVLCFERIAVVCGNDKTAARNFGHESDVYSVEAAVIYSAYGGIVRKKRQRVVGSVEMIKHVVRQIVIHKNYTKKRGGKERQRQRGDEYRPL